MGIHKLKDGILKKHYQPHYVPLYRFSGWKIAIDTSIWISKHKHKISEMVINKIPNYVDNDIDKHQIRKILFNNFRRHINKFLAYGITPIFVFDGKSPDAKNAEREKRKEDRLKLDKETGDLRDSLSNVQPVARDLAQLETLKKLLARVHGRRDFEDVEGLQAILTAVGLPWLHATYEAEKLCSALARENKVAAVYSTDSDNLAHRCPFWISDVLDCFDHTHGQSIAHAELYIFSEVLQTLELNADQFVELCILSGCDYNTHIKGFTGLTAYKKYKEFGSYYNLPADKRSEQHNFQICMQEFAVCPSNSLTDISTDDLKINRDMRNNMRSILEQYSLDDWIEELLSFYQRIPDPMINIVFNPFPATISFGGQSTPKIMLPQKTNRISQQRVTKAVDEMTNDHYDSILKAAEEFNSNLSMVNTEVVDTTPANNSNNGMQDLESFLML